MRACVGGLLSQFLARPFLDHPHTFFVQPALQRLFVLFHTIGALFIFVTQYGCTARISEQTWRKRDQDMEKAIF